MLVSQQHPQEIPSAPLTLTQRLTTFIPVQELTFDHAENGQVIILWKDVNIYFGDMDHVVQKTKLLQALFPVIQAHYDQIEYVDIRFPENLVIKYLENPLQENNILTHNIKK